LPESEPVLCSNSGQTALFFACIPIKNDVSSRNLYFLIGNRNHSIKGRKKWATTTLEVVPANNLEILILKYEHLCFDLHGDNPTSAAIHPPLANKA
jgi:hypothetical protein